MEGRRPVPLSWQRGAGGPVAILSWRGLGGGGSCRGGAAWRCGVVTECSPAAHPLPAEGRCQSTRLRSIKRMELLCENLLKNSSHHLAIAGAWGLAAAGSQKRFCLGLDRRGTSLRLNVFFLCKASLKTEDEYSSMRGCITRISDRSSV